MAKQDLVSLSCGLVFGFGLAMSGMTDTRIVIGFLDITGNWNPALLLVMVGALAVTIPGFMLAQRLSRPIFVTNFFTPSNRSIESKPIIGSVIFGIGWGLYGYCPGPAIVSLSTLNWQPAVFVIAMATGMLIEKFLDTSSQ